MEWVREAGQGIVGLIYKKNLVEYSKMKNYIGLSMLDLDFYRPNFFLKEYLDNQQSPIWMTGVWIILGVLMNIIKQYCLSFFFGKSTKLDYDEFMKKFPHYH